MDRQVKVFLNNKLAGTLVKYDKGFRFTYDSRYLAHGVPIAYRLPLQKEPFDSPYLFPFFENLASEGWLRSVQSQQQKIDERDTFSMLIENGRDIVGAISLEEVIS